MARGVALREAVRDKEAEISERLASAEYRLNAQMTQRAMSTRPVRGGTNHKRLPSLTNKLKIRRMTQLYA